MYLRKREAIKDILNFFESLQVSERLSGTDSGKSK